MRRFTGRLAKYLGAWEAAKALLCSDSSWAVVRIGPEDEALCDRVDEAVRRLGAVELLELDGVARSLGEWRGRCRPVSVMTLSGVGALAVFSMERDGHTREAAVRELASRTEGFELAPLLIRLNDWVEEVREAARAAVEARAEGRLASWWLFASPIVDQLLRRGRANHAWVAQARDRVLRSAEAQKALEEGLASPDRATRRTALRHLIEGPRATEVVGLAFGHADPAIRAEAARRSRSVMPDGQARQMLLRAASDKNTLARREAVRALAEMPSPETAEVLRGALLDRKRAIRRIAQWHVGKAGGVDPAACYRECLANRNEASAAVAVHGLGECGGADDARLIAPLLNAADGGVREAAVGALGRLDLDSHFADVARRLADHDERVSRAARDALRARPGLASALRIEDFLARDIPAPAKRHVVTLLGGMTWWRAAAALVRACADEPLRPLSLEYLERFGRSNSRLTVTPGAAQVAELRTAASENRAFLTPQIIRDIQEMTRPFAG